MSNVTPLVVVESVSIFDAVSGDLHQDWTLIARDGTLDWIGPVASAPDVSENAYVINGAGKVALPGLIDCHVHLAADGSPDFAAQQMSDSVPRAVLRAAASAGHLLENGITTVRDCGSANNVAIELGRAISDGLVWGPRVVAAGRVITMTGGHCHFIGQECDGEDGVRAATRREIKAGAQFIKVMATGGVLTPGVSPQQVALIPSELRTIVETAHNAGKRVTSHAIGNAGIKNALRANVDSIEHGFHLDPEAIQLLLDQDAFLVPTLHAIDVELENEDKLPPWIAEKALSESHYLRDSFVAALAAGVKIAAGTDAGTPFNLPGELARELERMVDLGMSPTKALLAATRDAADNIGLLSTLGTLEQGKVADVVIVDGDPTRDITALRRVAAVLYGGRVFIPGPEQSDRGSLPVRRSHQPQ